MKKPPLGNVLHLSSPQHLPLILETSTELPLVHFMIALHTGSLLDPAQKQGLTRFVARMMRRTAGNQSCAAIDRRIDELGGSVGVDVGSTAVLVHGTVISRSLEPFAQVLIDIVRNPGFSADEQEKLRRETASELIQARDDDRHLARRAFKRRVFGDHPQGRSVSGTLRSIESFDSTDIREQYLRISQLENTIVALCGDIPTDRAEAFASELASGAAQDAPQEQTNSAPQVPAGRRLVFVDKPERTQTQIFIGGLGTHPADEDHVALHVANTVFGGTFTARLTEEIRVKRGWSYGAYSSLPYGKFRQPFSIWTFPKAGDAAACIALQLEMLQKWHDRGITRKELASAKRFLTRSHAFTVDTPSKRVGLAAEKHLFDLPPGYHEQYTDNVQAVTLDQANGAIRARIAPDDLLVSLVGTYSEIGKAVTDSLGPLSSSEVLPYDIDE